MSSTNGCAAPNDHDLAEVSYDTLQRLKLRPWDAIYLRNDPFTNACSLNNELTTTLVRLVPSTSLKDNVLRLHPLLYECLQRSHMILSSNQPNQEESDKGSTCSNIDTNTDRLAISPWTTSSLQRDNLQRDGLNYCWIASLPITPVIEWSQSLSATLLFSDYDNNNNEAPITANTIAKQLEGRLVVQGSSILVLPAKPCRNNDSYSDNDALIVIKTVDSSPNEETESCHPVVYRIGANCSVSLDHSPTPDKIDDDTPYEGHNSKNDSPGYEDLLKELTQLFQIDGATNAAPSGILLSGCTGVGKTRMASCLAECLVQEQQHQQKQDTATSTAEAKANATIVHTISVRDVLLQASHGTESDLIDLILPPNFMRRDQTPTRRLLILDDLNVLTQEGGGGDGETDVPYDPERLQTKNAILQAMDRLMDSASAGVVDNNSNYCSVLGIARDSLLLPREFTCVGRLEVEVCMMPPSQWQRELILHELLRNENSTSSCDGNDSDRASNGLEGVLEKEASFRNRWVSALVPMTCGCVAGDLRRLCADAWTIAWAAATTACSDNDKDSVHALHGSPFVTDRHTLLSTPTLTWESLKDAAQRCVPSQLSQLDVTKAPSWPNEFILCNHENKTDYRQIHEWSWRYFGGYELVRKRLYRTVVAPWRHFIAASSKRSSSTADETEKIKGMKGIPPPSGVLFHGPPGTGKTLAASCLASSLGLPMVKVRASDILDQWLGGSEAAVRSLFARARAASPCILFFDEIDAIATNRQSDDDSGTDVTSRLLSTFLNEMDGISGGSNDQVGGGVLVVAATNRLDSLDAALLRPGRLEEHVMLPLPVLADILGILKIQLEHMNLNEDVHLEYIAGCLVEINASGADAEGFCRRLCLNIMRRMNESSHVCISIGDVDEAFHS